MSISASIAVTGEMIGIYIIILIIFVVVSLVVGISLSLAARRGDDMVRKALDELNSKEKPDSGRNRGDDVT
jgi:mannose/fructose/N-acetylgalactosamine-specific phosphotransferase system component IID